jgi:hypothetical protein
MGGMLFVIYSTNHTWKTFDIRGKQNDPEGSR